MKKLKPATIRKRLSEIARMRKRVCDNYEADLKEISGEQLALRKRCPHPKIEFFPDPAGGFSSFYYCTICGVQAHSREKLVECYS